MSSERSPWDHGLDGCRAGWVVASRPAHASTSVAPHIRIERELVAFLDGLGPDDRVGIDMPIGLLDRAAPGGRDCDRAARRILSPHRHSSVFSAPSREVLTATDWSDARLLGLSKQAWHLVPKIRELDDWITSERQKQVAEFHPELCFASLLSTPAVRAKRTAEGLRERLAALPQSWSSAFDRTLAITPRKDAQPDDLVDALGVLARVEAWRDGSGLFLPDAAPPLDSRGLRMEIRG